MSMWCSSPSTGRRLGTPRTSTTSRRCERRGNDSTRIPALGQRIAAEGITEIDGYRLDDGTRAVLRGAKIWKPIIAAVNGYGTAGGSASIRSPAA